MVRDVILFDLDGTLVDSAPGIATAINRLRIERGGTAIAVDEVRPLVALGAEQLVRSALGDFAEDPSSDVAAFRGHLRTLPPDPADLYPGVRAMLAEARSSGRTLGIVTNKPEQLSRLLLGGLGLIDYFGAIVGGDSTSACKPDPLPVRRALRLLDAEPDRAVFVGDTIIDAQAAENANLPFLLFLGGYGADDCVQATVAARFSHHDELLSLSPFRMRPRANAL